MKNYKLLTHEFFDRDTPIVAKDLLGKLLIRKIDDQILIGIINETEAYTGLDPAAHCYKNIITPRNKALFGPVGHAYVYLSYGLHYCFNIVSRKPSDYSGGVLIRSVIPIQGQEIMGKNRHMQKLSRNLTNGPGKVAQAFDISLKLYGINLLDYNSELKIAHGYKIPNNQIMETPRIGISKGKDLLWRFIIKPEFENKLTL